MFTQCRGCGEIFKVIVDDLVTASAMVRCSSCGTVFNALDTLSDYKPQQSTDLILHEQDNPPPLLTHEFKESIIKPSVPSPTIQKTRAAEENQFEAIDDDVVFNVNPDFAANDHQSTKKPSFVWAIFTLILIALLLWQTAMAIKNGSIILPEGTFREKVCSLINCYSQSSQSNPNNIALVSRSIRQHAGRDNALTIKIGIINSDEKVQAFPALEVKMSNLNGDIVAMRRFLPSEYLKADMLNAGMLPNTLIPITLELQSPGQNAVTFEVGFSPTFGEK